MKFKSVLSKLDKELGSTLEIRRYNLGSMISESYRTLYDCEPGTNMHRLVESHLDDVKNNPTDTERLSRQLAIIKEVQKLTESGEIKDKDLDAATDCEYEGDIEKKVAEEREERLAPTEEIKESKEDEEEDLLEDTNLTDEEVEALTQHLAEIRKAKKVTESEETEEELDEVKLYEPTKEEAAAIVSRIQRKYGSEISEQDYMSLISSMLGEDDVSTDIIDHEVESAGIKIIGESMTESASSDYEVKQTVLDIAVKPGTKIDCIQGRGNLEFMKALSKFLESQGMELANDSIETEDMTDEYKYNEYEFFSEESTKESKTYESLNLSEFRKKSAGKAFIKTFKKLDKQLHEGTALTRQEAISLYKAANSAMTHLSVELEHNPEFLGTFNESVSLLSVDVSKLLESMKNGKAPSKATMKSLAKFSEAMLREADEEEELPPIEDEEDTLTAEDGIPTTEEEEVSEFDQEYAAARVELHKELAEEYEDDEDPEVEEKLAQDAEEITNLPGVTEEQAAEVLGEESAEEETPEEPTEEEEIEDTDESAPVEEKEESEEETPDLDLGDDEITDDELAELKKHLREFRESKKVVESKGRKLARRAK